MNKFKIGDRVKIKGAFGIHKGEVSYKLGYFSGSYSDRCLELVETSEEIAVKKFKEELKNKINKLIKKLEKSLVKLTNTDRAYQQGKIEQLRELLKLL